MSTTPADPSPEGLELVLPARVEPAGAGWTWIAEGWQLFMRAPLMWIIGVVIIFLVALALGFIPFVGSLAFQVLQPVLMAGFVVAARSLERGGEFELEHLFAGFTRRLGPLCAVGFIFLAGSIAIMLVLAVFVGFSILGAALGGSQEEVMTAIMSSVGALVLGILVASALYIPLLAAYWFAPALVMVHGMAPVEAMKASFWGCLHNWLPWLVYGVVMFFALLVAIIPFGLGLLVLAPLAISSSYVAYRRLFTEEVAEA
jgi:uncharacterized membrane protein